MTLFLPATVPARDENGTVQASATWQFFRRYTTTPQNVGGGVSSVTADGNGDFADIDLAAGINYGARLVTADGRNLYQIESYSNDLFAAGVQAAIDAQSNIVPGALWKFYTTGTTTPQPVYADPDLNASLGSQVEANANGVFPQIYLDSAITYKAVLETPAGVQLGSIDPVSELNMLLYLDPDAVSAASQFTFDGVTWTLSAEQVAGQYAGGDYWVAIPASGSVTLNSATPVSAVTSGTFAGGGAYTDETLHGMMVNPAQGTTGGNTIPQGFQSFEPGDYMGVATTLQPWSGALNVDPGIVGARTITTPQTLVKAVIDTTPPDNARDGITQNMSALTFVSAIPSENSFRPSPRQTDKTSYFTTADMDISFLPNVTAPASMPSYATLLARVDKLYQTFYTNNLFSRSVNPEAQHPVYGRDIAHDLSEVLLALCTDGLTTEQKTTLMTHVCQLGLDILNAAIDGANWGPVNGSFGGGQHWVKCVAIVTAHALRNAANTTKATQLLQRVDPALFTFTAEDRMWFYVSRTEIETFPDQRSGFDHIDFKDYMENAPMWNSKPSAVNQAGAAFNHVYKTIVWTSMIGQVLAVRMMGIDSYLKPAVGDFMDFIYDHAQLETPGSAPNWIRTFPQAMLTAHLSTESSNYSDSAVPSVVRAVGREKYVWLEFDKLLSRQAIPATSAFTVNVNGSPATLVSRAADDFSDTTEPLDFLFRAPDAYGYSLAVELVTPLAEGDTVTIAYTKPGTNNAVTLGGAEVPNVTATAVTNQTGLLPDPLTTAPITFYGRGTDDATTQYSGTNSMPSETIDWLQLSARFQINSKSTNDTFISSATNSTTRFWMYLSSTTNMRLYFGAVTTNRVDFSIASLPEDTDLTMHLYIDYSQSDEADAVKVYFEWDGGSYEPTIASAARTPDTPTLDDLFSSGFYVGGPVDSTTNTADMSHTGYILRFGQGSTPAVPTWTDAVYNWDADWGGNGQNVWGEPDYYWAAADILEANGSIPNRGNNGALAMTPRRIDLESEDLVTPYTEVV